MAKEDEKQETEEQPSQNESGETQIESSKLKEGQTIIRANQTGISYKKLFANHLAGATEITLQDPYIRFPYQFKNLLDFCVMLAQNKPVDEEIQLKVITWNKQEFIQQADYDFQELTQELSGVGIHLTHEFHEVHDRYILSNNGWKITLGRGLDIFEARKNKFDIAEQYQELRKCKDCEITYIKLKK